ncbi:hypothetical protein [Moorena sp. SIO3I6]|nr:hypothetical protein [Moorena sp. SIO3I6]NEP24162.1 hypothetical protein [Moorena sp. SIO3I6]
MQQWNRVVSAAKGGFPHERLAWYPPNRALHQDRDLTISDSPMNRSGIP